MEKKPCLVFSLVKILTFLSPDALFFLLSKTPCLKKNAKNSCLPQMRVLNQSAIAEWAENCDAKFTDI